MGCAGSASLQQGVEEASEQVAELETALAELETARAGLEEAPAGLEEVPRPQELLDARAASAEEPQRAAAGSQLAEYFTGAYLEGRPFQAGEQYRVASREEQDKLNVSVLRHRESGIYVSAFPVDLRTEGRPFDVVFHYTSQMGIVNIMNDAKKDNEIYASMEDKFSHFGRGMYAAGKCPEQFGSKQAVLLNNYWPRCGDPEMSPAHEANLLKEGGGAGTGPHDPRNAPVCRAILQNAGRAPNAEFCVPVLVDRDLVYDIWSRTSPDLKEQKNPKVQLGCNRWGELQWRDRDVKVLVIPGASSGSAPVERRVEALRRRLEFQEGALGPEHPSTLRALGNLAETLSSLGRDAEAEPLKRRCLEASERTLGPDHPSTLRALGNLAATLSSLGRDAEAEPLKRRCLEASKRSGIQNSPKTNQRRSMRPLRK